MSILEKMREKEHLVRLFWGIATIILATALDMFTDLPHLWFYIVVGAFYFLCPVRDLDEILEGGIVLATIVLLHHLHILP